MNDIVMPLKMAELLSEFLHLGVTLARKVTSGTPSISFTNDEIDEKTKEVMREVINAVGQAIKQAFGEEASRMLEISEQIRLMRPHDVERVIKKPVIQ